MSTPESPLPAVAQWPEISLLLDEALDLPPSAREAWLAQLPAADAVHRKLLGDLLGPHVRLESAGFLETLPPLLSDTYHAPELVAGHVIGPYRLVREIGRGGMGSVWLAVRADGMVRRQVALKLPHAVWGDTFAERLARERQILATLEHPHIARLYDTGLDERGRPWIAMEHVDGMPIDAWCLERNVSVRERLALLLQVLGAVAHAHHRLVVHRDLKPANILVTQDGQAKLLDFGIAKLMQRDQSDATTLTAIAGRALTIDYASPEQIRGEPLGTASDVYSLGVVAYELLAQRRPYHIACRDGLGLAEAIAKVDPPRLSDAAGTPSLRKVLRGDLDAVLARALEKDVSRRYPGVDAFAQDIQRHLAGEPVQARPASRGYRAAKFVRRHRIGVAMVTALVLSIGSGAGVSLWQAQAARQQATRASSELLRQEAARELFTQTLIRLAAMAADDPASIQKPHAIDAALRQKLDQMLSRGNNTPVQIGAILEAVTMELNYLDNTDGSLEVGQRYLAHLLSSGGDAHQVIFAQMMVASNLCNLRRLAECEATIRAGLAWSPETDDVEMRIRRIQLLSDLGGALTLAGKRDAVLPVLEQARRAASRVPAGEELAALADITLSKYWRGFDETQAIDAARTARDIFRHLQSDAEDRKIADRWLGRALLADGQSASAELMLRESLDLTLANFGRRSATANELVCDIADAVSAQGRYREAHALLDEQATALGTAAGARNEGLLRARRLAVYLDEGDAEHALAIALTATVPMLDFVDANEGLSLGKAKALVLAGRGAESRATMEAVVAGWPGAGSPTATWTRILLALAQARLAAGDAAKARSAASELIELLRAQHATASSGWREANELLALACTRLGDRVAAAQALATARAVKTRFRSPVEQAESALNRAEVIATLGREAEAKALAEGALAELQGQSPASPRLVRARRLVAEAS